MGVRDRILRMKARAADLATNAARRDRARAVIYRWNVELVRGADLPVWSPTFRTALIAGMPWLDVLCQACATIGVVERWRLDRHPETAVASLVVGLTCSRCGLASPLPRLLGLHALRPDWRGGDDQGGPLSHGR